jgi:hypothetical protein
MFTFRSGKRRNVYRDLVVDSRNKATEVVSVDIPTDHTSIVQDLWDEKVQYEVLTFGTHISGNTFSYNYSGKRGTALLIELINHLKINDNKFMENGPV